MSETAIETLKRMHAFERDLRGIFAAVQAECIPPLIRGMLDLMRAQEMHERRARRRRRRQR